MSPPSPPRSRRAWILAAAAAGAILIAAVASRGPSGAPVETARVERRDLVVAILCDGVLEPA
ncbi:MAG: efflux RND transporter periplasmic adaptor subunit, partial [Acidobacteriota bacterium]|nr:efflux RND transporter periplasmic adaptor subunit [Acidobacteriota bacterium]